MLMLMLRRKSAHPSNPSRHPPAAAHQPHGAHFITLPSCSISPTYLLTSSKADDDNDDEAVMRGDQDQAEF